LILQEDLLKYSSLQGLEMTRLSIRLDCQPGCIQSILISLDLKKLCMGNLLSPENKTRGRGILQRPLTQPE
jgi:hypothetical protein